MKNQVIEVLNKEHGKKWLNIRIISNQQPKKGCTIDTKVKLVEWQKVNNK